MTTQPPSPPPDLAADTAAAVTALPPLPYTRLTRLPDPLGVPRPARMTTVVRAYTLLSHRYHDLPDALVWGRGYLCRDAHNLRDAPDPGPDCVVCFNLPIPPAEIFESNGYAVNEIGQPPDFVLEVGSSVTLMEDRTVKRDFYASIKVGEYWCFDQSGGRFHDAPITGERLTPDGRYARLPLTVSPEGIIRGYSPALELELHWVAGHLYLWDPNTGEYLLDYSESIALGKLLKQTTAEFIANIAARRRAEAEAHSRQPAAAPPAPIAHPGTAARPPAETPAYARPRAEAEQDKLAHLRRWEALQECRRRRSAD